MKGRVELGDTQGNRVGDVVIQNIMLFNVSLQFGF